MLLIKATSLLSLLQIADIVHWADRLGAPNFTRSARASSTPTGAGPTTSCCWCSTSSLTFVSEKVFAALTRWAGRGMADGEAA